MFRNKKMQIEIQSLVVPTGYTCKYCNGYFSGQYVFIQGEMFVKGECNCSFWLVKSSYMNNVFNYRTLNNLN